MKSEVYDALFFGGIEWGKFVDYLAAKGIEAPDISTLPRPKKADVTNKERIKWVNDNKTALRKTLELWGTNYRREQDHEYWTALAHANIERALTKYNAVFVDDVRFLNEVKTLENVGFEIIRIQTGDQERIDRGARADSNHPAETELDQYYHSFTVFNNLERSDLYRQLDGIVEVLQREFPVTVGAK